MKKLYFYPLVLVLLILQSCTYKPGDEVYVKLDPTGKLPVIEINLNVATDTIYVQRRDHITFTYLQNREMVNWSHFIINGKEILLNTTHLELSWYLDSIPVGTFPLELKFFTKSQTGSIADKVGAEGFLVSKKWTVVVKDQYHLGSKVTKVEFANGSLRLEWEMFKGVDFKYYKVYKTMPYLAYSDQLVTTITSQDQTSFVDNTYHGEESNYYVVTNDAFYSNSFSMKGPLPILTASNTLSGDILLTWNKPPYYKNLRGYRVGFYDNTGAMHLVTETINSDVESCVVPKPLFAYNYEFYLSPLALNSNFYDDWNLKMFLSTKVKATYGVPIPTYGVSSESASPTFTLYNYTDGILLLDQQTLATIRTIKYDRPINGLTFSENSKYLMSSFSTSPNFYLDDLSDPANLKKLDLKSSYPNMYNPYSISNMGTGVIVNMQNAVLYDYVRNIKLAEINLIHNGSYATIISPSGNFFYVTHYNGNDYFQYKDNQIIRLPDLVQSGDFLRRAVYIPGANEKLVRTFPTRIEVIDCNTWTIEKSWPYPNQITEAYNLNLKIGKMFIREKGKLILFDYMNGTKEVLKAVVDSSQWNVGPLFYYNGQILWAQGKAIN